MSTTATVRTAPAVFPHRFVSDMLLKCFPRFSYLMGFCLLTMLLIISYTNFSVSSKGSTGILSGASSWVDSKPHFRHICLGARTFCYIEKAARNCAKMLILFFLRAAPFLAGAKKMVKMLHYYFYYLFAFNTSRRGRRRKATPTMAMARTNVIQSQSGCRLLCILSRFYLCASCS